MDISLAEANTVTTVVTEQLEDIIIKQANIPQDYNVEDSLGSYSRQMNPHTFMQTVRNNVLKELDEEIDSDTKQMKRLANKVQGKILGFSSDGTWGDIKDVTDEFVDFIFEGNEDEIKKLRAKFKRAAKQQLSKLNDIKMPDLFNYAFKREVEKVMEEERKKALPLIRKIISDQIRKEVVQPWQALAKMQGIDTSEIY